MPAPRRCCNAPVAACAAPVQYMTDILFTSADTMGRVFIWGKRTQKPMMFDDDNKHKKNVCILFQHCDAFICFFKHSAAI